MKLSNPSLITPDEAADLLVHAGNDRDLIMRKIDFDRRLALSTDHVGNYACLFEIDRVEPTSSDPLAGMIPPVILAKWAIYHRLELPPALVEMLPPEIDYERPDPDLSDYMRSHRIEHLIATIRQLDNDDGTTIQGSRGWAIVAESYPAWSDRKKKDFVRLAHAILTDTT